MIPLPDNSVDDLLTASEFAELHHLDLLIGDDFGYIITDPISKPTAISC